MIGMDVKLQLSKRNVYPQHPPRACVAATAAVESGI